MLMNKIYFTYFRTFVDASFIKQRKKRRILKALLILVKWNQYNAFHDDEIPFTGFIFENAALLSDVISV